MRLIDVICEHHKARQEMQEQIYQYNFVGEWEAREREMDLYNIFYKPSSWLIPNYI